MLFTIVYCCIYQITGVADCLPVAFVADSSFRRQRRQADPAGSSLISVGIIGTIFSMYSYSLLLHSAKY